MNQCFDLINLPASTDKEEVFLEFMNKFSVQKNMISSLPNILATERIFSENDVKMDANTPTIESENIQKETLESSRNWKDKLTSVKSILTIVSLILAILWYMTQLNII